MSFASSFDFKEPVLEKDISHKRTTLFITMKFARVIKAAKKQIVKVGLFLISSFALLVISPTLFSYSSSLSSVNLSSLC